MTSCEGGGGPFLRKSWTPRCKAPPAAVRPCPVVSCRVGGSAGERAVDPQGARDKSQQGRSPQQVPANRSSSGWLAHSGPSTRLKMSGCGSQVSTGKVRRHCPKETLQPELRATVHGTAKVVTPQRTHLQCAQSTKDLDPECGKRAQLKEHSRHPNRKWANTGQVPPND